jgi:Domain of unknown function (DUF4263)
MSSKEFIYDGCAISWPSQREAIAAIKRFEKLVDVASNERDLQTFLQGHPYFLAWLEPHCHHVVIQPRLGSQLVPDFLLPEMSSAGTTWVLVEIERSDARLTTKSGDFGQTVRTALHQIRDWQRWLEENRDYAIRSIPNGGLGLEELKFRPKGLVIVGRRPVTDRFNSLRADCLRENIEIMTYDRVIEWAKNRAVYIHSAARSLEFKVRP